MSVEIETVFRNRAHGRGLLFSFIRAFAAGLHRAHRRRVTDKALARLNSDALRDIGLERTALGYRELGRDRLAPRLPGLSDANRSHR